MRDRIAPAFLPVLILLSGCAASGVASEIEGAPMLKIGSPGPAPAWAQAELKLFAAYEGALGAWVDRFVEKDTGSAMVQVQGALVKIN